MSGVAKESKGKVGGAKENQKNDSVVAKEPKEEPITNGSNEPQSTNKRTESTSSATEGQTAENGSIEVNMVRSITLTSFGGIRNVKVQPFKENVLADNEVTIKVKACGLGFQDLMLRQGAIDVTGVKLPMVMGTECAGEVTAVGSAVTTISVGDRVSALTESKSWSELVNVPAKHVYKMTKKMDFKDAVTLTTNYVIGQALLFDVGNLKSGQTILVHSVGGGVGQAVVQLARTVSDVTIIGTASAHKHESIKDVNHLLDISSDYATEVKKISPDGVDLVLDCLCGDDTNKGYNLLKPLGKYVLYGMGKLFSGESKSILGAAKFWWQVDKVSPLKLYDENKTICGFNLRKLLFQQDQHEYVRSLVENVYKMWEKKKLHPIIDSSFAFEDVSDAMQKMHDRRNVGKIILDPNLEPKVKPVPEAEAEGEKKPTATSRTTSLLRKLSTKTVRDSPAVATSTAASSSAAKDDKASSGDAAEEKKENNGSKKDEKDEKK